MFNWTYAIICVLIGFFCGYISDEKRVGFGIAVLIFTITVGYFGFRSPEAIWFFVTIVELVIGIVIYKYFENPKNL